MHVSSPELGSVTSADVLHAVNVTKPSASSVFLKQYDEWTSEFGSVSDAVGAEDAKDPDGEDLEEEQ
jgi:hypothetical protein